MRGRGGEKRGMGGKGREGEEGKGGESCHVFRAAPNYRLRGENEGKKSKMRGNMGKKRIQGGKYGKKRGK